VSPKSLAILKEKGKELWLAELGAWLHNLGKLSTAFQKDFGRPVRNLHPKGIVGRFETRYPADQAIFSAWKDVWAQTISLPAPFTDRPGYQLGDFIELHDGGLRGLNSSALTEMLHACHEAASGSEKHQINESAQEPAADGVYLASPFGYARSFHTSGVDRDRDAQLLPGVKLDRPGFLRAAQPVLSTAVADTQWPVNDISLWDFSSAVAAFFKAALAKCILEGKWPGKHGLAETFAWRLLRVGINGPDFYGRVARLPDLLIRRELMKQVLDRTQEVFENELFLANEIYRDEYGSVFLAPVLQDDLSGAGLVDAIQSDLKTAWKETGIEDVVPRLERGDFIKEGIFNPKPDSHDHDLLVGKALGLGREIFQSPKPLLTDSAVVAGWWAGRRADVCPVCGLRPQGSSIRKVCKICEVRREPRSRQWFSERLDTTIWLEEVADRNGSIAVVCGRFQLKDWLATRKKAWGKELPASFARIRRVWQTTNRFWEEVQRKAKYVVPKGGPRIRLLGRFRPSGDGHLSASHTYLLERDGGRFSFVCTGSGVLLSAENLERAAILAGAPEHEIFSAQDGAEYLSGKWRQGTEFKVEEPTGYGFSNHLLGSFVVESVGEDETPFDPVIPISCEPRSFQLLAPASEALEILDLVQREYEVEMGKVRQRLPIQLGVVFASAATPLYAVLDGARRMIERPLRREPWPVTNVVPDDDKADDLHFSNGAVWRVSRIFPDGTRDRWHPYFQRCGRQPPEKRWALSMDLQAGDTVCVYPSTFDFEFLDVAARRFEIAYTAEGRRGGDRPQSRRPYPLHRLRDLREVWAILDRGLTRSQIQGIRGLLVEKAQAWLDPGETYLDFAITVLEKSHWRRKLSADQWKALKTAVREGYLLDSIELHVEVLKSKEHVDQEQEAETAK
jgi:hypothetical protein